MAALALVLAAASLVRPAPDAQATAPSELFWLNHLDLLPGGPEVTTSHRSTTSGVGGGLTGLVIESSTTGELLGDGGNKVVHMSADVPPDYVADSLRICYELSSSGSFISQARLAQVQDPPSTAIVKLDDPTDHTAMGPVCVDTATTVFDTSAGAILFSLRVNFGNTADRIVVRGLALRLIPQLSASNLMWLNHFDLLPGGSEVTTSFNSTSSGVGGGLTGLVIQSSTLGEDFSDGGNKLVHMAVDVPPFAEVSGVRVCYELTSAASYISQIRLHQVQNPPAIALVKVDDPTDLTATGPTCVDSVPMTVDPAEGALNLSLRVNFGNLADKIVVRGIAFYVDPASSVDDITWVNHFDLLSGGPEVTTSYRSTTSGVGGGLTGTVIESSTLGDVFGDGGNKAVHMAIDVPANAQVSGVRVCYELTSAASFITQIRLAQVDDPPAVALVMLDDATDQTGTGPVCVDSSATAVDPDLGAVLLSLRLNFGSTADKIVVRGVALLSVSDDDADKCGDGKETAPNEQQGGDRSPSEYWDFYEVTGNKSIDLQDTLAILRKFGLPAPDGSPEDLLDRAIPNPSKPWRTSEADNGIDLSDALNNLRSFGHVC
jgi:hypothetical protein